MKQLIYAGNYSEKGIAIYSFSDGVLTLIGNSDPVLNPSYLATSSDGKYVFAVLETEDGELAVFKRDGEHLSFVGKEPVNGAYPCHVNVHGKYLYTANYGSGSLSLLSFQNKQIKRIEVYQDTGSSVNKERQEAPHVHFSCIVKNELVYCDLGTDELMRYQIHSQTGKLTFKEAVKVKPGSGPRHFVKHPALPFIYVIMELTSEVAVLDEDYRVIQTISILPRDFKGGNTAAAIKINGDFLYATNRGHDSIAICQIKPDGHLDLIRQVSSRGTGPRDFTFDKTGKYLLCAHQYSQNISVFKITGDDLEYLNSTLSEHPVCLLSSSYLR